MKTIQWFEDEFQQNLIDEKSLTSFVTFKALNLFFTPKNQTSSISAISC